MEAEPAKVAAQIVLAAADRQLATLERTGPRRARLRVRLPLTASPASRRDWAWHVLPLTLPPTVPPQAALCTPTLRVRQGRVRVDLPFRTPIEVAPATGHVVACGFDWGVNTLLTGVTGRLAEGRVLSDGRPLVYDASGVSAKLHRLRAEREHLAAKRRHQERLLAGITVADPRFAELSAAYEVIGVEHERVCARIRYGKAVLDAAAYADEFGLWVGPKAKVPVSNGVIGYLGDGTPTTWINVYRNKNGFVPGSPGSPR